MDPHYPSLHFKCVDTQESIYSVRVSRNYRAVGVWKGDTIYEFCIGSHEDYNNLL
jgi:plasmid maintenance system killer protein